MGLEAVVFALWSVGLDGDEFWLAVPLTFWEKLLVCEQNVFRSEDGRWSDVRVGDFIHLRLRQIHTNVKWLFGVAFLGRE